MNLTALTSLAAHHAHALTMVRVACTSLCIVMLFFAGPPRLLAQGNPNGTLSGVVSDASGGVLPGVTILATNAQTGLTQQTVTGSASSTAASETTHRVPSG